MVILSAFISLTACLNTGNSIYKDNTSETNRLNKWFTMNIPFQLRSKNLDLKFVIEAAEDGLLNLNGWRTVGGMRASIYNAVPEEAVDALVEFMKKFEARHG